MKNFAKTSITLVAAAMMTACMSTPRVSETQPMQLQKAAILPSAEELSGAKSQKIIVVPVEATGAEGIIYAQHATTGIEQGLLAAGNDVIERSLAEQLGEELLLIEMQQGGGSATTLNAADIAVMAKLSDPTFSFDYRERSRYQNKDGDWVTIPPKCTFDSSANISVRAYRLPSMTQLGTYTFEADESEVREDSNSRCPISEQSVASLKQKAIDRAIAEGQFELLNAIAPKAYVLDARQVPGANDALYRVSIGNTKGAREGGVVEFFRLEERVNQLTGAKSIEEVYLGEGEFTADISANAAYVHVSDKELVRKLLLGDIVKMKHNKCDGGGMEMFGNCVTFSDVTNALR